LDAELQARLDRQRAFWKRENHDRPVIGFTGTYFAAGIADLLGGDGCVAPRDLSTERFLAYADAQFEAWQGCSGDLFWTANPLYQFRWLAAAAGAPVFAGGDSVWAEPFIDDYGRLARLAMDSDNAWLQKLWALTDALVDHAGGRFPVAANEFMSPLSALADLRGNTELAFDLYDRPEAVKEGLARFTEIWVDLLLSQYERVPAWHGGYTSAQRYIWAPGHIAEFSEDPAFMFSPRLHREFVLDSHRQVLHQVEYAYIHLHSTQLHTLEALLELEELAAIELTPDHGASIAELIPIMAQIQARKCLIVHAFFTAEEMWSIVEQIPPEGLCVIGRAETPEDARQLQEALLGW
jgi:hypothetical protein